MFESRGRGRGEWDMRPKGSAEELERRRRRAMALHKEGKTPREVAEMVGASESSFFRWREMAEKGVKGLAAVPHPGRPCRMTAAQCRELKETLKKGARGCGWANDLWTGKRVTEVIRRKFGIRYNPRHVHVILKRRLGWTSQRPEQRARERDEIAIERWRQEEFPLIKKKRKSLTPILSSSTKRASC